MKTNEEIYEHGWINEDTYKEIIQKNIRLIIMPARTFDKGDFLMLVHEQERKHIREEENKRIHEEELKKLRDDINIIKAAVFGIL